jgi:hypothetical protein
MLFGLVVLTALGCPRSAFALTRWSAGIQIESDNYDYLAGYGDWVQVAGFGTVWHPSVVQDWMPFAHGHWTWTYDGWAWVSYEPFGWLVYHYGNWYYDDSVGWFWVPGTVWSPAQVQWYTFGGYCGWAPLPPPGYYWGDPWTPWRHHHFNVWFFVNVNHFGDDNIWGHREAEPPSRDLYKRSVVVRRAPGVRDVERITNRQITPIRITRERVAPQVQGNRPAAKYARPKVVQRSRMVLPQQEQDRVKQYAPQVEREVLVPRGNAPKQPMPVQQRPVHRSSGRQKTGKGR